MVRSSFWCPSLLGQALISPLVHKAYGSTCSPVCLQWVCVCAHACVYVYGSQCNLKYQWKEMSSVSFESGSLTMAGAPEEEAWPESLGVLRLWLSEPYKLSTVQATMLRFLHGFCGWHTGPYTYKAGASPTSWSCQHPNNSYHTTLSLVFVLIVFFSKENGGS